MTWTQKVTLEQIREHIAQGETVALLRLFDDLQGADIAEIVSLLDEGERTSVFRNLSPDDSARVFEHLDYRLQSQLLVSLGPDRAREILGDMFSDDLADLVGELNPGQADEVLSLMEDADAEEIRDLLSYPETSAGGIMTTELVKLDHRKSVDDAIKSIRADAEHLESVYYVYVTKDGKLVGVVTLRQLIIASPAAKLKDIMEDNVVSVRAEVDQEEVARLLSKYDFIAMPVVDSHNRLLGMVTIDDVLDVLSDEATEDISKFGGTLPLDEPYLTASVYSMFKKRIGWLLVLFVAQAFTSVIMKSYEVVLGSFVSLAFFIPLLIDTGGNAGSQAATLVIRGMAVGEVNIKHAAKVFFKEMRVGLLLGAVMGVVTYGRALMMGESAALALTVTITIVSIILMAVLMGSILPMILKRLKLDPAVVSGPFITTFVDTLGLLIYFVVAAHLLGI